MKIAIGICAKNEENSIIRMLNSVYISCSIVKNAQFFLFICANGCSDATIPLITDWQMKHPKFFSKLCILNDGNLVEAQREIINNSINNDIEYTIFLDADILLGKYFFSEIIKGILINTEALVLYAKSIPLLRNKPSLIEKALNLYDISGVLFSKKKHLHGRAFVIKTSAWFIPHTNPQLIADDIYLSFYLLYKYGTKSIKCIDTAKVYFNQINNFRDYYYAFRRRKLEIEKCLFLFSHFNNLPKDQVNRKFLWNKLHKEPFNMIVLWIFLFVIKKVFEFQFKIERILNKDLMNNQWIETKSTKII